MTAKQPEEMVVFVELWEPPGVSYLVSEQELAAVPAGDIDKVLELVRPLPNEKDECRHVIACAIVVIRRADRSVTRPSDTKKKLIQFEATACMLRSYINELRQAEATELRADVAELDRIKTKSAAMANDMRPSGGIKFDTVLRMIAAQHGYLLTDNYHDQYGQMPSLTKDGPYIRTTNMLYRVATGKKGDCANACAEHFREHEECGTFTREYLKRIRKEKPWR